MTELKFPTIYEVARQAGVSQATASAVVNGASGNIRVSAQTRARVLDIARELGYVPHPHAQALRRQRSKLISFAFGSEGTTPYDNLILHQLSLDILRAVRRSGYQFVEVPINLEETIRSDGLGAFLLRHQVAGVLIDRPDDPNDVRQIVDAGLPTVQLIRPQYEVPTASIVVDAQPGIDAAIDHLVSLGHTRIAFEGNGGSHPVNRARTDSFLAAMARHGIPAPDGFVQLGSDYSLEGGYELTRAVLSSSEKPTALLVASDRMAMGALRALYEADIRVPEAMSLVSYDDVLAEYLYPPLTSIAQPIGSMAERAVSVLLQLMRGDKGTTEEPAEYVLPTYLVVRGSTCPFPER